MIGFLFVNYYRTDHHPYRVVSLFVYLLFIYLFMTNHQSQVHYLRLRSRISEGAANAPSDYDGRTTYTSVRGYSSSCTYRDEDSYDNRQMY